MPWIVRRFLQAGVLDHGVPLSSLLANLVLDELDRELDGRGLRFVRYADDCNVYVLSERAATRAFENLIGFIEGTLKLKVNRGKSAVARPWERKLLGFSFTSKDAGAKRRIAPKALAKAKARIRELTQKSHRSFQAVMTRLRRFLVGWLGYFRFCETPSVLGQLEKWTRRRLRCLIWQHWKRGAVHRRELVRRGLRPAEAAHAAGAQAGAWRMSRSPWLNQAFPRTWFLAHGLPSFPLPVSA